MTTLDEASKEIANVIKKHMPELKLKYSSIEHHESSIQCKMENGDCIKLQAIPDHSRNNIRFPKNSAEYQSQGGHKSLAEKFSSYNKDAWKIELKKIFSGKTFEVAISGNERNWNILEFEKNFVSQFLQKA